MDKQTAKNNIHTGSRTSHRTAVAHARYVRISPRKMRLVANAVKNMWATEALAQLRFMNKKGAGFAINLIKSAIANAENNFKLKKDKLYIKSITCDSGPKLKRYMPRAQGRATELRRPTSHIHVLLEEMVGGGTKARKFNYVFDQKEKAKKVQLPESKEDAPKEEKPHISHGQIQKSKEQMKSSRIQQKRRLFNRKSGE